MIATPLARARHKNNHQVLIAAEHVIQAVLSAQVIAVYCHRGLPYMYILTGVYTRGRINIIIMLTTENM